jgi:hypothetical protein
VYVEPGAADDELDVMGQVEDAGDEGEAAEEEEEGVCMSPSEGFWLAGTCLEKLVGLR